MREPKVDSEFQSEAFQQATLRSERARVLALLGVFGSLLVLVLIRGGMSLAQGHRGEAWPFALLLAVMTAYEALWLRFVGRAIGSGREVSTTIWTASIFVESLFATAAIFLQIYTPLVGPHRALTSPAVLGYFLFIILSTLHLHPGLSRLAGVFSAAGYVAVAIYIFSTVPGDRQRRGAAGLRYSLLVYSFSACGRIHWRALWPGTFAFMLLQLFGKRRTAPSLSRT